jgi:dynein light chain Tctex-type 1
MESQNQEITQEDISSILKRATENFGKDNTYKKEKATQYTQTIIDFAIKELVKLKKHYKFTVTCVLMQKNGAGLTTGASLYGENTKDGYVSSFADFGTFQVILTAFHIAI